MAKVPQALKFTKGLQDDLKFLADVKKVSYNSYVESVLSAHVLIQKRAVQEMKAVDKTVEQKNGDDKRKFPLTQEECFAPVLSDVANEDEWV